MPVCVEIPDNFFDEQEKQRLRVVLGIPEHQFGEAVSRLTLAALAEYKDMLLGKGVPNRAEEVKWVRLYQLMRYYFRTRMPTEAEIASMFQLTETQSRSLIRNTRSRFRQDLEPQVLCTLRNIIESTELRSDGRYIVVIQSDNALEELNSLISRHAPTLDPITKMKNASRTYEISPDSYDFLRNLLVTTDEAAAGKQE